MKERVGQNKERRAAEGEWKRIGEAQKKGNRKKCARKAADGGEEKRGGQG